MAMAGWVSAALMRCRQGLDLGALLQKKIRHCERSEAIQSYNIGDFLDYFAQHAPTFAGARNDG